MSLLSSLFFSQSYFFHFIWIFFIETRIAVFFTFISGPVFILCSFAVGALVFTVVKFFFIQFLGSFFVGLLFLKQVFTMPFWIDSIIIDFQNAATLVFTFFLVTDWAFSSLLDNLIGLLILLVAVLGVFRLRLFIFLLLFLKYLLKVINLFCGGLSIYGSFFGLFLWVFDQWLIFFLEILSGLLKVFIFLFT